MFCKIDKLTSAIVAVVCMLVILGMALAVSPTTGPALAGSQSGNVIDPEAAAKPGALVPPAPVLIPPDIEHYSPQRSGTTITGPDKRPVAQLAKPPADLAASLEAFLPLIQPLNPGISAHTILASVRYTGSGHILIVTTSRRSAASAQQAELLGTQTIFLTNGTKAWATAGLPFKTPNEVVFLHGDLIITIAGDLSVDKLQQLAGDITISQ